MDGSKKHKAFVQEAAFHILSVTLHVTISCSHKEAQVELLSLKMALLHLRGHMSQHAQPPWMYYEKWIACFTMAPHSFQWNLLSSFTGFLRLLWRWNFWLSWLTSCWLPEHMNGIRSIINPALRDFSNFIGRNVSNSANTKNLLGVFVTNVFIYLCIYCFTDIYFVMIVYGKKFLGWCVWYDPGHHAILASQPSCSWGLALEKTKKECSH